MKKFIGLAAVVVLLAGCATLPELKNHNACFLGAGASIRYMNILSPRLGRDGFKNYVVKMKDMGANFAYVYTMNQKDGPWTPYSLYQGDNIGGSINESVVKEMDWRLGYLRDEGLGVVIVLRADDSPNFNAAVHAAEEAKYRISAATFKQMGLTKSIGKVAACDAGLYSDSVTNFVRTSSARQEKYQKDAVALFDKYASAYWVGLEVDEYYNTATVEVYASQLQKLTAKPILTHQTSGKWNMAGNPSVDAAAIQYGFGQSASYIQSMTQKAVSQLGGKPVYGTEYHKSSETEEARNLGDAVMRGGGQGTGNNRHNPPKPQKTLW